VRSPDPALHYTLQGMDGKVVARCLGRCTLSVPSETARSAGLFLGIGGPILLAASFVVGQRQGSTALPWIGAGLGGVLTASGWYLFAANSSPGVQLTPIRQRGALLGIGGAF
jgi:hypothetical protein